MYTLLNLSFSKSEAKLERFDLDVLVSCFFEAKLVFITL